MKALALFICLALSLACGGGGGGGSTQNEKASFSGNAVEDGNMKSKGTYELTITTDEQVQAISTNVTNLDSGNSTLYQDSEISFDFEASDYHIISTITTSDNEQISIEESLSFQANEETFNETFLTFLRSKLTSSSNIYSSISYPTEENPSPDVAINVEQVTPAPQQVEQIYNTLSTSNRRVLVSIERNGTPLNIWFEMDDFPGTPNRRKTSITQNYFTIYSSKYLTYFKIIYSETTPTDEPYQIIQILPDTDKRLLEKTQEMDDIIDSFLSNNSTRIIRL